MDTATITLQNAWFSTIIVDIRRGPWGYGLWGYQAWGMDDDMIGEAIGSDSGFCSADDAMGAVVARLPELGRIHRLEREWDKEAGR